MDRGYTEPRAWLNEDLSWLQALLRRDPLRALPRRACPSVRARFRPSARPPRARPPAALARWPPHLREQHVRPVPRLGPRRARAPRLRRDATRFGAPVPAPHQAARAHGLDDEAAAGTERRVDEHQRREPGVHVTYRRLAPGGCAGAFPRRRALARAARAARLARYPLGDCRRRERRPRAADGCRLGADDSRPLRQRGSAAPFQAVGRGAQEDDRPGARRADVGRDAEDGPMPETPRRDTSGAPGDHEPRSRFVA